MATRIRQKAEKRNAAQKYAHATAKYVRMSPSKITYILDLVRGKKAQEAVAILENMPDKGAFESLKVLKSGDVVEIYRDGKLISTTDVSSSNTVPEISTGGVYKIVIKAVSGAQIEYNFTRKQIANTATSVFIIIACFAAVAGIGIGLLYHTKIKNDSEK